MLFIKILNNIQILIFISKKMDTSSIDIDTRGLNTRICNCSLYPKNNCGYFNKFSHSEYRFNVLQKHGNFNSTIEQNINKNNINGNKNFLISLSANEYDKPHNRKNLYNSYLNNNNCRVGYFVNIPKSNMSESNLNILMNNISKKLEKINYYSNDSLIYGRKIIRDKKTNLVNKYKNINEPEIFNSPKNYKPNLNYKKSAISLKFSNGKKINKISKNSPSNCGQNNFNHYYQRSNIYYNPNKSISNNILSEPQYKFSPIELEDSIFIEKDSYQNDDIKQNIDSDYDINLVFDKKFPINDTQKKCLGNNNLSLYNLNDEYNSYVQNVPKSSDHLYQYKRKIKQSNINTINNDKNSYNFYQPNLNSRFISLTNNPNKRINIYNGNLNQINSKYNINKKNPNGNKNQIRTKQNKIRSAKFNNDRNNYIAYNTEKTIKETNRDYHNFNQIMNVKINNYIDEKNDINKILKNKKNNYCNNSCSSKIKQQQYIDYLKQKQEKINKVEKSDANKKINNIFIYQNQVCNTPLKKNKNSLKHFIKEKNCNKFKEKKQQIRIYNIYNKDNENNGYNNRILNEKDIGQNAYYLNSKYINLMKNIVENNKNKHEYERKRNNNNFYLDSNLEDKNSIFLSLNKNSNEFADNNSTIKPKKNDNGFYNSDKNNKYFNVVNSKYNLIEQKIKYNTLNNKDINKKRISKELICQRVNSIKYGNMQKNNQEEVKKIKSKTNNNSKKSIVKNTIKKNVTQSAPKNVSKLKTNYPNLKSLSSSKKKKSFIEKLNIDINLSIGEDDITLKRNINISTKTIFTLYTISQKLYVLCFDLENRIFSLIDFADFGNFEENYKKSKRGTILISIGQLLYIITGKNNDMFYVFDSKKKEIYKLCDLNNNHSNGGLIKYNEENIICISGEHNKKVEVYNINNNKWITLNETLIERSNFGHCLFKNGNLFLLFGYNYLTNEFLNTIEFLNIDNALSDLNKNQIIHKWKYLKYKNENLIDLNIKHFLCLNYIDNKIIIIGGYNGNKQKSDKNYIEIQLIGNFEKDGKYLIKRSEKKLKDIDKYNNYIFNKGESIIFDGVDNIKYNAGFDSEYRCHIIQHSQNLTHNIYCY